MKIRETLTTFNLCTGQVLGTRTVIKDSCAALPYTLPCCPTKVLPLSFFLSTSNPYTYVGDIQPIPVPQITGLPLDFMYGSSGTATYPGFGGPGSTVFTWSNYKIPGLSGVITNNELVNIPAVLNGTITGGKLLGLYNGFNVFFLATLSLWCGPPALEPANKYHWSAGITLYRFPFLFQLEGSEPYSTISDGAHALVSCDTTQYAFASAGLSVTFNGNVTVNIRE